MRRMMATVMQTVLLGISMRKTQRMKTMFAWGLLATVGWGTEVSVLPATSPRDELWSHVGKVEGQCEVVGMSARFDDDSHGRVLRISVASSFGWVAIPAPEKGWPLATRGHIDASIRNAGDTNITVALWVVGRHGWGAISDFAKLKPGESRNYSCLLGAKFRDGMPILDPAQVRQVQVMIQNAKGFHGVVEVRDLRVAGEGVWKRPPERLEVPDMERGVPGPGKRVRYQLPGDEATRMYCALYLPTDWKPDRKYPVIMEYPGSQFYVPGCYSEGTPEACVIGYGMTKGVGAIWVSLPFVDGRDIDMAVWGKIDATRDYACRAVETVCARFGGDTNNVVLTGFSRGAIACGFIGLRDDRIASLWKAFHLCQHYDGDGWRGAYMSGAIERARRIGSREVFQTDNGGKEPRKMLSDLGVKVTFATSGLGAHDCAMFLDDRPSTVQLREWFTRVTGQTSGQ